MSHNPLFDPSGPRFSLLYRSRGPVDEGPTRAEIWKFWIGRWRARLKAGRDLVIVIDADRTGSPDGVDAGATRAGKSTLGLEILQELDPTFTPAKVRNRVAGSGPDLARYVIGCERGNGFLYDEGMWGARGRDAMSPETKMVGEVLGTLASRGAIVVFCCHSMLTLDPEVKALASYRLLVRRRGLAEVHTPTVQLDLERPRLLPFRQHEMSPIEWAPLRGKLWNAYTAAKTEMQDERIRLKLEEQRVYQARRLGQRVDNPSSEGATAGGPVVRGARAPAWKCSKCGSAWGRRSDRDRHEARCSATTGFG
ncbi:MAG TPA: hypothetical protein VGU43_04575 [Thermoplasmata archaeon]|nr:hypothetical protein [Thermoplasmata archaeon]